jgi:hypothetical protein
MFFTDLTGYKPPATATGAGLGAGLDQPVVFDVPYAIDLVAPRATNSAMPKAMAGSFTFTMKFKVFVKNEIK